MAIGGGVDVVLTKYLAWRFVQADYLMTNFSGSLLSPGGRQNNFRVGTGVVSAVGLSTRSGKAEPSPGLRPARPLSLLFLKAPLTRSQST